jgi:hypothetical protein
MAFPSLVLGSFNLTDWAGVAYNTSVIAEGTSAALRCRSRWR